ncbi:hypothetical protein [Bacteroides acidifaciens]|uniref:hypothetical protein n=1 Tax=Bacteroides acidifaciens TaxID=85831 RepID=UPI00258F6BA3|nr:hypothetical protein [Bacteroides acidifaciens]
MTTELPGFNAVSTQTLSDVLKDILSALDDVEDANKIFSSIAEARQNTKVISTRNAITINKAMEMASGNGTIKYFV